MPTAATELKVVAAVAGVTPGEVAAVADVFRAPRVNFLMPPRDTPLEPDTMLDVSHESLLRRWDRLREWVAEEAKSADIFRQLTAAARDHAGGRAGRMDRLRLTYTVEWERKQRPTAAWAARYGGDYKQAMAYLRDSEAAESRQVRRKYPFVVLSVAAVMGLIVLALENSRRYPDYKKLSIQTVKLTEAAQKAELAEKDATQAQ